MEKIILISGYYGFSNPGDDAILEAILSIIKKKKELKPVVLYNTRNSFVKNGVYYIPRNNPFAILYWIGKSSILLSGGGGLFQDATSFSSLLYYSLIVVISHLLNKKVFIFGQSFGPLKRHISFLILRYILHISDSVFVRDVYSIKLSYMLGRRKNIFLMPDVVYSLPIYSSDRVKIKRNFLFFPRKIDNINKLILIFKELCEKININILIFPLHYNIDLEVSKNIFNELKDIKKVEIWEKRAEKREILEEILSSFGVISCRFHGLLFSHMLNVSFLGISSDMKIISYLNDINLKVINPKENNFYIIKDWMYEIYTTRRKRRNSYLKTEVLFRKKWIEDINNKFLSLMD